MVVKMVACFCVQLIALTLWNVG